jgi:hypothetical protein
MDIQRPDNSLAKKMKRIVYAVIAITKTSPQGVLALPEGSADK